MTDDALDLSSLRSGHRERLRQKFLDEHLAKYEILELLLSYAIPRRDVRPLSRILYKKFGGVYPVFCASVDDLTAVPGMGRNTAIFIKAIQQIMLESYKEEFQAENIFQTKEHFNNYCKLMLGGKLVEEMHVLYMDVNHRLLEDQLHSVGNGDSSAVFTTEIVRHAMGVNAKFVVLVHNHPRAWTSFSDADVNVTRELQKKLDAVGLLLTDHFVVSGGIVYSMRDSMILV